MSKTQVFENSVLSKKYLDLRRTEWAVYDSTQWAASRFTQCVGQDSEIVRL
jgi:hypothetical protein